MRQDPMKTAAVAFAVRAGHTDEMAHRFLEAVCGAGVLGQRRQYGAVLAQLMRSKPEEQGVSARKDLKRFLSWPTGDLAGVEAEALIDAYAHELAEEQRAAEAQWRESGYAGTRAKGWLPDLIDPEVLNSGS